MTFKGNFSKGSVIHWAIILFGLHLVLALVFCFLVFPQIGEITSGLDPDGYGQAGQELYESGRFVSLSKAPLYPAFVALVCRLVGDYYLWAIQAAQCLLSACTVVILYAVLRCALQDEGVARLAGLACALYPMTLWYIPRLWTETFLTFTLALFTLALARLLQAPNWYNALLAGLAAGVVALSKGIGLVFTPLGVIVILLTARGRKKLSSKIRMSGRQRIEAPAWQVTVLFCLGALALLAPWTWRNWRLSGAFLPVHADGGYNFFLGNGFARHWPQAPFSYARLKALTVVDQEAVYAQAGLHPQTPLQRDEILMAAAWDEIKAKPLVLARKVLLQSLTFWYLAADLPKSALTGALQIPVVILAIPGIIGAIRRRSKAVLLLVPVTGIMGASVLVFAFARLSATIMPYMIGLAVYGLQPLINRIAFSDTEAFEKADRVIHCG